jgi:hypothetical protein
VTRATRAAVLIVLVLGLAGCGDNGSSNGSTPSGAASTVAPPRVTASAPTTDAGCEPAQSMLAPKGQSLRMKTIALVKDGGTLSDMAIGGGYIVWSTIHIETGAGALYERKLSGGPVRLLNAPEVVYPSGLASGPKGVYVVTGTETQDVMLLPHGGGPMTQVIKNIVAPLSQRGDQIGYAAGLSDSRREVGVIDTATGKRRALATDRACDGGVCSRIDQVELTDDAVVWSEGAIGDHPSYLVRQPLAGGGPTRLRITGDVQPDLASANGPVPFRRLGCAWQTWDGSKPAAAAFDVPAAGQLIALDSGTWYGTLGGQGQAVVARGAINAVVDRTKTVSGKRGVGVYGGLFISDHTIIVGWNVYVPHNGQLDHEEPSFSVVRLGRLS